jgi:carboxylesterase type B
MVGFSILLVLASEACAAHLASAPPAVNTTSGLVTGKVSKFHAAVSEYLGIRFGESTAGKNRFMPPKRYYGKGLVDGTKFGSGCMQGMGGNELMSIGMSFMGVKPPSEDCLFINVWTKSPNSKAKRPVLLWIYGGAFSVGDSSWANMNGANITNNHDIVVVSFNYRLSMFGFPGAPGLEQLNPGLLDQRMAAEWTRDNIEAFGGDPSRITLFGESAGGSSVDYYAYAWPKDPIVAGFIVESGTAMMHDLFKPAALKSDAWFKMSQKIGCGGPEAGVESLKCAQRKTPNQLMRGMPAPSGRGFKSIVPAFAPTADEKTVFSDVHERSKKGIFAQKVSKTTTAGVG